MNARILAAASGLIFLLAWLVGLFAAPSAPDQSDSAAKIAAYFADNERASMAQTALVDGLAGLAFVLFAFAVYAALRRTARATQDHCSSSRPVSSPRSVR
jgi:hypothetical protein